MVARLGRECPRRAVGLDRGVQRRRRDGDGANRYGDNSAAPSAILLEAPFDDNSLISIASVRQLRHVNRDEPRLVARIHINVSSRPGFCGDPKNLCLIKARFNRIGLGTIAR